MDTVLLDMDGTLLNTLEDLQTSSNYALTRAGLPAVSLEEVRIAAGLGLTVLLDDLSHHAFDTESPEFKAMFDEFQAHYSAHCNDTTAPYPGIMDMLAGLKERGFKMAVVSNKAHAATEALRQQWFADYIDVAVGLTLQLPKKPAPDMAFAALEQLGSSADAAYYVGDSEPDAQIAHNSGCTGISVLWGFRDRATLEAQNPAYLVESPAELLAVVDAVRA